MGQDFHFKPFPVLLPHVRKFGIEKGEHPLVVSHQNPLVHVPLQRPTWNLIPLSTRHLFRPPQHASPTRRPASVLSPRPPHGREGSSEAVALRHGTRGSQKGEVPEMDSLEKTRSSEDAYVAGMEMAMFDEDL